MSATSVIGAGRIIGLGARGALAGRVPYGDARRTWPVQARGDTRAALLANCPVWEERLKMELGGAMKETFRIDALSADERLELLERIWESLSETPSAVPVTDAQRAELDRRALSLDRDLKDGKPLGVPWDEVMRQLRARR